MINYIVVDDEPLARQLIISYAGQIPGMHLVGEYQSAVAAFEALHTHNVDVVFIDVEMPGINGINFIRSLKKAPKVIFITAYSEYAVEAFELDAVDYLVKPVTFERFLKTIQKLSPDRQTPQAPPHQANETSIFLKVDKRLIKVDLDDLMYAEALGDYLKVHCRDKTYITYLSLARLEALLPPQKFIRIHRSTIVNKQFISFVEGNFIRVGDKDLAIGVTYREGLLRTLGG
jgi:DNA-binding LytR/AlgR family response regulator